MTIKTASWQAMGFLRESELFKGLSDDVLRAVLLQSASRTFKAGEKIFEQGDPGDYLCIVKSGVVEISARTPDGPTTLAYLGTGACLGEVALLTGSSRTATARVPEQAEIISMSKEVFDDLIMNFPAFLKQLCVLIAHRLEETIHKMPSSTATRQLQGHLRYFDLGLMLQTLVESRQTGRMTLDIRGPSGHVRAELFFRNGSIVSAKMGRLQGEEAVYQLFQMSLEGTFNFVGSTTEEPPSENVSGTSMSLLLESARLQDDLAQLEKTLSDPGRQFRQKAEKLRWTELETAPAAAELWSKIDGKSTLLQLVEGASVCRARVYHIVALMLESGQAQ